MTNLIAFRNDSQIFDTFVKACLLDLYEFVNSIVTRLVFSMSVEEKGVSELIGKWCQVIVSRDFNLKHWEMKKCELANLWEESAICSKSDQLVQPKRSYPKVNFLMKCKIIRIFCGKAGLLERFHYERKITEVSFQNSLTTGMNFKDLGKSLRHLPGILKSYSLSPVQHFASAVTVSTDHCPLQFIHKAKDKNQRILR